MAWTLEFAAAAEADFGLIFDHLLKSYMEFGEPLLSAFDHAETRLQTIRKNADRILLAPKRGGQADDIYPGLRFLTIDRAIYWFILDEGAERVTVLAVFYGGQNARRRMLLRLLS